MKDKLQELEQELAELLDEYFCLADCYTHQADLAKEQGYFFACQWPCPEILEEDEVVTGHLHVEEVEPLPVKPMCKLRLIK